MVTYYYRRLAKSELPGGPNSSFLDFINHLFDKGIVFPGYLDKKDYERVDYVIRYEHLQENFSEALKKINIEQKNPLKDCPDPTPLKKGYLNEYNTYEIKATAILYLRKAMASLGYSFPPEWNSSKNRLFIFLWIIYIKLKRSKVYLFLKKFKEKKR